MHFQREDKVRLTEDVHVLHMAESVKKGETGTLTKLYRVQEDLEIWRMVVDRPIYTFIAVPHTKIEKI